VAYVDEVEEPSKDRSRQIQKVYYSALVKAALPKSSSSNEPGQNLDQVLFLFILMLKFTITVYLFAYLNA